MNANSRTVILLALVVGAFLYGMVRLLFLRFEAGDVYPAYSSFRTDPLGVRALYDALDTLPGISVSRNDQSIVGLGGGRNTTLFLCGVERSDDPPNVIAALEAFMNEGGRLVITFLPDTLKHDADVKEKKESAKNKKSSGHGGEPESDADKDDAPWSRMVSIADRWGFAYTFAALPGTDREKIGSGKALKQGGPNNLPASLSWHTELYFDKLADGWRTLYARDGHAVMIEREWGRGSIVLSSDAYLLSNEAMAKERHPDLLTWLVGPSSNVVFDENHLGVDANHGIVWLIHRYRLDPFLAALLLIAGLFVWKSATSLTPKRCMACEEDSHKMEGADAAAALVNLLRRSIPAGDILRACVDEWLCSMPKHSRGRQGQEAAIRAIVEREARLPASQRDAAAAYRAINEIIESDKVRSRLRAGKETSP